MRSTDTDLKPSAIGTGGEAGDITRFYTHDDIDNGFQQKSDNKYGSI